MKSRTQSIELRELTLPFPYDEMNRAKVRVTKESDSFYGAMVVYRDHQNKKFAVKISIYDPPHVSNERSVTISRTDYFLDASDLGRLKKIEEASFEIEG